MRKFGFTLAEILITLGIIGVVAALTLPSLITKHQKKVAATQLKETYSIVYQALERAKVEHGDFSTWEMYYGQTLGSDYKQYLKTVVDKYFIPYVNTKQNIGFISLKNLGYDNIYTLDGKPSSSRLTETSYYVVPLSNGSILRFIFASGCPSDEYITDENGNNIACKGDVTAGDIFVYIDINGSKKPNTDAKDIFVMRYNTNGLQFWGCELKTPNRRQEILNTQCKKGAHRTGYCGCVIMLDGWEIKDDYPW